MLREACLEVCGYAERIADPVQEISGSVEQPPAVLCRDRAALYGRGFFLQLQLLAAVGREATVHDLTDIAALMLAALLLGVPERFIDVDVGLSFDRLGLCSCRYVH